MELVHDNASSSVEFVEKRAGYVIFAANAGVLGTRVGFTG